MCISRIRGLLHSDDTQRCMEALCLLHPDGEAAFEWEDGGAVLAIKGANGKMRVPRTELYLGIYIYVYIHIYMYIYIYMRCDIYVYVHVHTYIYTHIYTYIYIYIYVYIRIYLYTQ